MICSHCKQAEVGISELCPVCKTFNLVPRYRIVPGPETDAAIKALQENPGQFEVLERTVFMVEGYDGVYGVFSTKDKAEKFRSQLQSFGDDTEVVEVLVDCENPSCSPIDNKPAATMVKPDESPPAPAPSP